MAFHYEFCLEKVLGMAVLRRYLMVGFIQISALKIKESYFSHHQLDITKIFR
jgi:hypothetical protein